MTTPSPITVDREWYPEETHIFPGLENCRIRYKTVNIVMTTNIKTDEDDPVDLQCVAFMMPMLDILGFSFKPGSKLKIPYYGYENSIVSVRYGNYYRGVRDTSKPLKNNIYIDLQLKGKNQHLKVSAGKVHITGVRTEETGKMCIDVTIGKINMISDILRRIRSLEDKKAFEKLCYADKIEKDCENFDLLKFVRVNMSARNNTSIISSAMYNYRDFVTNVIYGKIIPSKKPIEIANYSLRNQVFYVNVCFEICLVTLCKKVVESGHNAAFNNWNKIQYANIKILVNYDSDVISNVSKKPLRDIRYVSFKVNGNGGINIWSIDDNNVSFDAFNTLVEMLAISYKSPGKNKRRYERKTPRNYI